LLQPPDSLALDTAGIEVVAPLPAAEEAPAELTEEEMRAATELPSNVARMPSKRPPPGEVPVEEPSVDERPEDPVAEPSSEESGEAPMQEAAAEPEPTALDPPQQVAPPEPVLALIDLYRFIAESYPQTPYASHAERVVAAVTRLLEEREAARQAALDPPADEDAAAEQVPSERAVVEEQ
jgi:translation initiation factor IF-2